jgi:hypothetical protein
MQSLSVHREMRRVFDPDDALENTSPEYSSKYVSIQSSQQGVLEYVKHSSQNDEYTPLRKRP